MALEMLWGEERKCSATVVDLDLVLAFSEVRRFSLKRAFKRRVVFRFYCKLHVTLNHEDKVFSFAGYVGINGACFAS